MSENTVSSVSSENRPPLRLVVHAVMLSSAAPFFVLSSFVSYWCLPAFGFNFFTGAYFFCVYYLPGTVYVNEIGSFFPHKDKNSNRVRMSLLDIFKRIAISASYMTSVVVIASLVQGRLTFPYSEKIQSVLSAFMPSLITAGWNWLSTPAAGANAILPFTSPSLFDIIKMTCGWGLSYVTHFIGFGLIPHYLNKWWAAVKLSALALLEEEKKAAAQADSGSAKRNE